MEHGRSTGRTVSTSPSPRRRSFAMLAAGFTIALATAFGPATATASPHDAHPAATRSVRGNRATGRVLRNGLRRIAGQRSAAGPREGASVDERVLDAPDAVRATWTPSQRMQIERQYGLQRAALRADAYRNRNTIYPVSVAREGVADHIRDQESTGRCWIFSTLTVVESEHYRQTGEAVDLSEAYLNHVAWTIRANHVLDNAENGGKALDVSDLGEGGFQQQALALIAEHGIVPNSEMPRTYDADNTDTMIAVLQQTLASAQHEIEHVPAGPAQASQRSAIAQRYRGRVRAYLDHALGAPPEQFVVDGRRYTPRSYAHERLRFDPHEYVTLGSFSNKDRGTYQSITDDFGMPTTRYFNVAREHLATAAKTSLEQGRAAGFSAMVGSGNPYIVPNSKRFPTAARGLMSVRAFDYEAFEGTGAPPADVLEKASLNGSNHAMATTGLQPGPNGTVVGWRVDNSWGDDAGNQGHFHMDAGFFDRYVRRVLVPRSALPKVVRDAMQAASEPARAANPS